MDNPAPTSPESPFRGIQPFRFKDQNNYFGREELLAELVDKVLLFRLVVLFGESGAGKSSVLNAGLIGALRNKEYQPERLRVRPFSDQPLLIERIERSDKPGDFLPSIFASSDEREKLATFTLSLDDFHRAIESTTNETPVLIFDQFEELFTLFGHGKDKSAITEERSLQLGLLETIAQIARDPHLRVKIILTIRDDFLAKLQILARQYPQVLDHRVRIGLLKQAEAKNSILYPFRDPNPFASRLTEPLAGQIVEQLAATQPNLSIPPTQLQIVCSRLWDTYAEKKPEIGLEEFNAMGQVKGILKDFLTSELQLLEPGLREPAVQILGSLVTDSNTRDVVSEGKIRSLLEQSNLHGDQLSAILQSLETRRLINQVAQRGTYYYELSSEFLIEPAQKEMAQVQRKRELASALKLEEEQRRKAIKARNWSIVFMVLFIIALGASILAWKWALQARAALNVAEASEKRSRQLRYAANMSLAYQDLRSNNSATVVQLLNVGLPDSTAPNQEDLRSFIWYYLWRQVHDEAATLRGHSESVRSVAFSPDGKTLASAGDDKTIKLWNVSTHQEEATLSGHSGFVRAVAFSPDGRMLASGGEDKTIRLWDVGSRKLIGTLTHGRDVRSIAFSPDGAMLVAGDDESVKLWDVVSRKEAVPLKDAGGARAVAFSLDGKTLASGGDDRIVKLWDVASGKLRTSLKQKSEERSAGILSVAFSPDGNTLACSINDKIVELWDIRSATELAHVKENSDVFSIAFSPDGKMLASSGLDGTVKLRDVTQLRAAAGVREIATISGHSLGVLSLAFSPDGKMLATGSQDTTVKLTDSNVWNELPPWIEDTQKIYSVAFSPDGKTLAAASHEETIKLWDVATRKELARLTLGKSIFARQVAFAPDGQTLAGAISDGTVKLWDVRTWKLIDSLPGHAPGVTAVAFSPDGKTLASGNYDYTVSLWDMDTHKERILKEHTAGVVAVAFSPDGKTVASGSYDKTVRLWEASTGKLLITLPEHLLAVISLAFSPDSKLLAAGDYYGVVKLWDLETRKERVTLVGSSGGVLSVAFSPDGKTLAATGFDNAVKLWDVATQQELATLAKEPRSLFSVAFSPDGRTMVSAGADKKIKFWIAATNEDVERLSK